MSRMCRSMFSPQGGHDDGAACRLTGHLSYLRPHTAIHHRLTSSVITHSRTMEWVEAQISGRVQRQDNRHASLCTSSGKIPLRLLGKRGRLELNKKHTLEETGHVIMMTKIVGLQGAIGYREPYLTWLQKDIGECKLNLLDG